ncbi:GH1 family beta-glucosidase [Mucilaginibacter defluvii]|uniref:Beta-glucosidase n=1 Tax=Mucilaginibacter defluvii TaxID=1196019 RepID=A0ABP9FRD5_9SPHI
MEASIKSNQLLRRSFGNYFKWGVSTAAFQTEGSCSADGKGESIWDKFTTRKGKILNGDNAHTACDFYSSYKQDIDLVKQLNIPNFRFSIAWTRILPNGTGTINQQGIDHYNQVINYCLHVGVEPWVTLYHWDLPQALEDKGGWTNREVVDWFSAYVNICAENFGDRVKYWMVMNEPAVFTGAGYFLGIHAPGRTGLGNFLPAIHHAVLAIVAGAKIVREKCKEAIIGTTFSCSHIEPYSAHPRNISAAKRADALINRLFIEPILGLGYPMDDLPVLKKLRKYFHPGDEDSMSFDFDFIGIQNYTREIVKYSFFTPYISARLVKAENRGVPLTDMRWEVYPPAIYEVIKKFNAYKNIRKLIITENGAAFPDKVEQEAVHDVKRVDYLQTHLQQVLRAKNEGLKVDGYFVWTLTDNFEWAEGYHPRFGLIHIDFETQKRTVKDSGKWYAKFLNDTV